MVEGLPEKNKTFRILAAEVSVLGGGGGGGGGGRGGGRVVRWSSVNFQYRGVVHLGRY